MKLNYSWKSIVQLIEIKRDLAYLSLIVVLHVNTGSADQRQCVTLHEMGFSYTFLSNCTLVLIFPLIQRIVTVCRAFATRY